MKQAATFAVKMPWTQPLYWVEKEGHGKWGRCSKSGPTGKALAAVRTLSPTSGILCLNIIADSEYIDISLSNGYVCRMFTVTIAKEARRRLRAMPNNVERTIISKIEQLAANNNVTALKGSAGFRLRVGDWQVLYVLALETETVIIAAILPRGEAYR